MARSTNMEVVDKITVNIMVSACTKLCTRFCCVLNFVVEHDAFDKELVSLYGASFIFCLCKFFSKK